MTITQPLTEKLKVTWTSATVMALSTNFCWYAQSCEFNKITPLWKRAPIIGFGGNLFSFIGCMTTYSLTERTYNHILKTRKIERSEGLDFTGSFISGIAAAIGVIPGESRSVRSYAESEFRVQLNNKPLTPLSRTFAFNAYISAWQHTLARDSINYSLIFYGGPRLDALAQKIFPQIGNSGGALFASGCTSLLTVFLTNTFQHTRMNAQSNAWLRAAGRDDLATKIDSWGAVLKHTYKSGGLRAVAFKGSRWRILAIGIMQLCERTISNYFSKN
jgi:hypothetical protein